MRVQVGDGLEEFSPTPAEGRALITSGYRVPFTLLVRFENDAIDETRAVADVLQAANPAGALRGCVLARPQGSGRPSAGG